MEEKQKLPKQKKYPQGRNMQKSPEVYLLKKNLFQQGNLTKIIVLVTKVCQENVQSVEDLIISKAALRKVKNVLSAENLIISKKCAQI